MQTKSQVRRLGERLARDGSPSEEDLIALDDFRASFRPAYDHVLGVLAKLGYSQSSGEISARDAKTPQSILAKLRREKTRLHTMQDIAGCRIVVEKIADQNRCVEVIAAAFAGACRVDDRRERPSHGYRAVHLIVEHDGRHVEIQVRTRVQHAWAQLCEKAADTVDPAVKYGGGPAELRKSLDNISRSVAQTEALQVKVEEVQNLYLPEADEHLAAIAREVDAGAADLVAHCAELTAVIELFKEA